MPDPRKFIRRGERGKKACNWVRVTYTNKDTASLVAEFLRSCLSDYRPRPRHMCSFPYEELELFQAAIERAQAKPHFDLRRLGHDTGYALYVLSYSPAIDLFWAALNELAGNNLIATNP